MASRAIITVCVMISIGICAYTMLRGRPRLTPEAEFQPRLCDACGHRFRGRAEPIVTDCPKCGEHAAVRVYRNRCAKCGMVYDAFYCRYRDPSLTQEKLSQVLASDPDPELTYKTPGGDWGSYEHLEGEMNCPRCGGQPLPAVPK